MVCGAAMAMTVRDGVCAGGGAMLRLCDDAVPDDGAVCAGDGAMGGGACDCQRWCGGGAVCEMVGATMTVAVRWRQWRPATMGDGAVVVGGRRVR